MNPESDNELRRTNGAKNALDEFGKPYPAPVRQIDGKAWHPNENQVNALNYVLSKDCDFKIGAMAKAIGMSPQNWPAWRNSPAFVAWWRQKLEQYIHDELPAIMACLLKTAKGKKSATRMQVAAIKLLMERYDKAYIPRSHMDVKHSGEVKLGIGNAKLEAIFDEVASRFPKQRALAQDPTREHAGEENPA